MKSILNIIYWGVFAVLILTAVVVVSSTLGSSPARFFNVRSGSMSPSVPTGSVVLVIPKDSYGIKDIVTFRNSDAPGQTITHRIVGVEYTDEGKNLLITKGDANEDRDSQKIANEDVLGEAVIAIPLIGFLSGYARTPWGVVLLIVIPAMLFVISETKVIVKEIKKLRTNYKAVRSL